MPFNGSGTFSILTPPSPFVTGTTISAPDVNSVLSDIATNGLTNAVTRDGQSPLTANWAVGGYNITGVATLSATTLNISGTATIGTLAGITSLSLTTLTVAGAATVGSTLGVTGAITGSSTITGTSIVSGSTTLPTTFPWSTTADWEQNATVVNGDFTFSAYMPFAGTITGLKYKTASGTFTVAVKIAGSTVTGLSAVAVSSPSYNTAAASAANTFSIGDVVTGTISSATSSPTGAVLTIYGTRTL